MVDRDGNSALDLLGKAEEFSIVQENQSRRSVNEETNAYHVDLTGSTHQFNALLLAAVRGHVESVRILAAHPMGVYKKEGTAVDRLEEG